jgi:ankyrin repeat protein
MKGISKHIAGNIHDAARTGDIDALRAFIKAGVSVDARDTYHQTPLHWAACWGHDHIVRTLIELGANKEARSYGIERRCIGLRGRDVASWFAP